MTSYIEKNGRMVEQRLPADFGAQVAMAQDPKIRKYVQQQEGRYHWCARCRVAIPSAKHRDHMNTVHPDPKRF